MTRYLFLIYGDESRLSDMTPEVWDEMLRAHQAWGESVAAAGAAIVAGEALAPSSTATSYRLSPDGADPVVTDGPFAETKEAVGGFYLVDAPDLDVALALARAMPVSGVEVRPIVPTG
jgi:hypothetical protein